MAIKRPVTKARDEDEDEQPKKPLKKAPPVEEPEEEEEEEEEEEPAPKKKKKAAVEEEEEEEERLEKRLKKDKIPYKKKAKKSSDSFADIFDKTKPGGNTFPIGKFSGKIVSMEIIGEIDDGDQESDLAVEITYEGGEDEDEGVAGKTIKNRSTLFKDGEAKEQGIGFLKRDLDILGYEDVILEDLENICEQVTSEEPEVVFQTKQNGTFTNAYLQGLSEVEED